MFTKTIPRRLPTHKEKPAPYEGGITTQWYYILRWIAMIAMFIDHYIKIMYKLGRFEAEYVLIGQVIGRMAFPIFFCLLSVFALLKIEKAPVRIVGYGVCK